MNGFFKIFPVFLRIDSTFESSFFLGSGFAGVVVVMVAFLGGSAAGFATGAGAECVSRGSSFGGYSAAGDGAGGTTAGISGTVASTVAGVKSGVVVFRNVET